MSIKFDTSEILTQFQLRATAELRRKLDEVKCGKIGSVAAS